jgi:segregation and condensation protein A
VDEGQTAEPNEALSLPPPIPGSAFRVALPNFEGPLDLLLHLIKEHELDIFDIPIALVTEKYLQHLERMREINLEIAGEFLVMASTLAHIKSRLLLPAQQAQGQEEPEERGDPRAELVRRLLEYQKYREAAETLAKQNILHRDIFARNVPLPRAPLPEDELGLVEIDIYKLIQALDAALKRVGPELRHEVVRERVTISDAIHALIERLRSEGSVSFAALLAGQRRQQIVVTFLAVLEMCKLRLIRIAQEGEGGDIVLTQLGDALSLREKEVDESEYQ